VPFVRGGVVLVSGCLLLALLLGLAGNAAGQTPGRDAVPAPTLDVRIAALLARNCLECHNASTQQGGLDLTRARTALSGGKRGAAVVPGNPTASWLWKRVAANQMPPNRPLSAGDKALLKSWIAGGAKWGADPIDPFRFTSDRRAGYDWWSLQPVTPPRLPQVRRKDWPINPIDAFVLAKLEAKGLQPSPPADRVSLIRRLYFDVIGLPPAPEEVDSFVNDRAPDAYERLVDRLLASPHYGERWARHWLDVVRFGESQGFERNKLRPNAWKYRDWVVEALNTDMPYDEFVRLQLAGDVLRPDDPLAVVASGFLVMGPYDLTAYTDGTAMMRAAAREEELEGLVGTTTQTFLGLTANCARCHDHKFDPISQKEYYQIAAALGGTYHGTERESLPASGRPQAEQERAAFAAKIAALKEQFAALEGTAGKQPATAATGPAAQPAGERERLGAEISRLESRARLLAGGPAHVSVPKEPGVFHVLARGDFREKRDAVAPAGIAALAGPVPDWSLKPDAPERERRKALAAWITDPKNPLTARVMVNRLWTQHFSAGLVSTPSDFGFNGGRPSHPELLDWLAVEFVNGGMGERENGSKGTQFSRSPIPPLSHSQAKPWSLKNLHRLILTSATYRQASRAVPAAMKKDAENRLLWRQSPRRLDAEALRDAVLAVSGELDRTLGGPGFRDWTVKSQGNNEIYTVIDAAGPEFNRRTLYRSVIRSGTSPFLDVLDCPDPSVAAPRRTATTTPLQALSLLNNGFMERSAGKWAERLKREIPDDPQGQISRAYRLAFGRAVTAEEISFGERFAAEHGLAQFCLVLLNTNEFIHID
jgi:uncharacterized protein DUF1549/uncharacterized protein DUF1553/cytochrome c